MDQHLLALPITYRDARSAYPLISMYDASISLEEWLRFARRRCSHPEGQRGLIGIRDNRGTIHAVFGYRVDIDMRTHKRLCLSNLVMAQMPGIMIDEAVLASASELAAQHGCATVTLEQRFGRLSGARGPCPTVSALLARRINTTVAGVRRH